MLFIRSDYSWFKQLLLSVWAVSGSSNKPKYRFALSDHQHLQECKPAFQLFCFWSLWLTRWLTFNRETKQFALRFTINIHGNRVVKSWVTVTYSPVQTSFYEVIPLRVDFMWGKSRKQHHYGLHLCELNLNLNTVFDALTGQKEKSCQNVCSYRIL